MKNSVLLLVLMFTLDTLAQTGHQCGTSHAMQTLYEKHPELKIQRQKQNESWRNQPQNRTSSVSATYVIPVVIHILHQNGPENISDAQARDALRIMNLDYAKQNADFGDVIPVFQSVADSTKIQFVLATRDPDGNCTTGIIHHEDLDTDWNTNSSSLFSHTWDPTSYMNVYVVRSITMSDGFQAAGYAYYPGSWPDGYPYDAMVMLHNYFGTIGTGDPFLTRVLTHETGHWLNLAHVFGEQAVGTDCFGDDYINDTPPTMGFGSCPNIANPATYQICTPGVSENFQNFMDYSYCTRMFTQEQAQRMQFCLQSTTAARSNLWTYFNHLATGVVNPIGPCAPMADFVYSRRRVCVNTPVVFTDNSSGGTPASYAWNFTGGTPATSASSVQSVTYASPGFYNAALTISNTAGNSSKTKQNIIKVVSNAAVYTNNWMEGFENSGAVNNDWILECKNGAAYWERTNFAATTGAFSMKINRLSNTRKNRSSMTGPLVNVSQLSNPTLSFKVAVAESYPNHQNTLKVYVSSDCGQNWSTIYNKSTPTLISSVSTASDFIPSGSSEWRTETVSLSTYSQLGNLTFRFEYIRDTLPQTNNIYIDDININGTVGLQENESWIQGLNIYPVPAKDELSVSFRLPVNGTIALSMIDLLGRETEVSVAKEMEAGDHVETIRSLNRLEPGVYFLQIKSDNATLTRKIVISD